MPIFICEGHKLRILKMKVVYFSKIFDRFAVLGCRIVNIELPITSLKPNSRFTANYPQHIR